MNRIDDIVMRPEWTMHQHHNGAKYHTNYKMQMLILNKMQKQINQENK